MRERSTKNKITGTLTVLRCCGLADVDCVWLKSDEDAGKTLVGPGWLI